MSDWKELIIYIITIFTIIFCFIYITVATSAYLEKKACYNKYAEFNPEYVGIITGCLITVDNKKIPAESYRTM